MQLVCKGLSSLHEVGVVHRDLKPDKIMVDNATVKIADFIALCDSSRSRYSNTLLMLGGITHYTAPEIIIQQSENKEIVYRPPCDMWALGIICY